MTQEDNTTPEQDQVAYRYCVRMLKQEPEITYKELRREAWKTARLTIKRQMWTASRRELGLRPDLEPTPETGRDDDAESSSAPPRTEAPQRSAPPQDNWRQAPPQDRRPPPRDQWEQRPQRPFDAPRRDDGYGDPHRRPAWSQPARGPSGPPGFGAPPPLPAASQPPPWSTQPEQRTPAFTTRNPVEFMANYLRTINREATFQEVKDAAEVEGLTVYPATFGRAQAIVGIVEAAPTVRRHDIPADAVAPIVAARALPPAAVIAEPIVETTLRSPAARGIDPVDGITAYFIAIDRMTKDCGKVQQSMTSMLAVVRQALST